MRSYSSYNFLFLAIISLLLFLFSCKSSQKSLYIPSIICKSELHGNVDSVIVSDYSNWNYQTQEGIDFLRSTKTIFDKKGYINKVVDVYKNASDSLIISKITSFKYDHKHHLIGKEVINFDSIGELKNIELEELIDRTPNSETWKVKGDVEIRTYNNDTENISLLTDSGTIETGLTYNKKYSPNGKLIESLIAISHMAVLNTYEYNSTSGYLIKETHDSRFRFIEQNLIYTNTYGYINNDKFGNWTLRTRFYNDDVSLKFIYQAQKIYYRK